jgi:predicted phosphodiesterase
MHASALKNTVAIEQPYHNVLTLRFAKIKAGWQQWFLLSSDRHFDSTLSDHTLQKTQLNEARERDAIILDFGDMLDVMQSKDDRRANKSELNEADKRTAYLDSVVDRAARFYAPWANRWALLGTGNHESAVAGKHGTNLTDRLAEKLRGAGGITHAGGYDGWVRMMFDVHGTRRNSLRLYYHHGSGGAPIMSHGTLDTRRFGSWIDADIICHGHTHTNYILATKRARLMDSNVIVHDLVDFIRTPGYKQEGGWETERGHPLKPRGCVWMRLYYDAGGYILREFTPAFR